MKEKVINTPKEKSTITITSEIIQEFMVSVMDKITNMIESMITMQEAVIIICMTEDSDNRKEKLYACVEKIKSIIPKKETKAVNKDNKRKINEVAETTSDKKSDPDKIMEGNEEVAPAGYDTENSNTEYEQLQSVLDGEQIKGLDKHIILYKENKQKKRQNKVRKSTLK